MYTSVINCVIISATPINHTYQDHMLIQLRNLELNVGKDHQVISDIATAPSGASYTALQWLQCARDMCSREL